MGMTDNELSSVHGYASLRFCLNWDMQAVSSELASERFRCEKCQHEYEIL